jgi:hypothetical protein
MLQNLPVGIQSFSDLRNNNYLYVDKTEVIYRMITSGKPYFLSRPRRFGKSLTVSTLEAIFQGRKELFEGLYIFDKWDWTRQHPVIRIDLGGISYRTPELVDTSLNLILDEYFDKYHIEKITAPLNTKFHILIARIHQSTGEQVVVLVDEYDKPIIDSLHNLDLARNIQEILHDFYQVMKASDDHLRFLFLTGVSKFSKVSIFSGLNNLNDITLDPQYISICGYTQTELESYFDPYIDNLAQVENLSKQEILHKIKHWYDGYSWDGKTFVYNPFSALQLFVKKSFKDYWFESGTPAFLVNLIKEYNDIEAVTESFDVPADEFDAFDIQHLNTRVLLFQTGYLTVKKAQKDLFDNKLIFTLDIPNEEVHKSLIKHILGGYVNKRPSDVYIVGSRMMQHLLDGDSSAFERSMQSLFANIPHQLHIPREQYYHSLFILWMNLLGFKIDAEVSTDKGRIDAVWTWGERVVIAEIKYAARGKTEPLLNAALAQIRDRRYYERYSGENKRIALLAIAFAGKETACKMEEI